MHAHNLFCNFMYMGFMHANCNFEKLIESRIFELIWICWVQNDDFSVNHFGGTERGAGEPAPVWAVALDGSRSCDKPSSSPDGRGSTGKVVSTKRLGFSNPNRLVC